MNDDFPLDPECFTIVFPCFIVRSEDSDAFVCHALSGGGHLVAVLTDEDALDNYRHGIGLPGRAAARFETGEELLGAMASLPPQVTHVAFDLRRPRPEAIEQSAKLWKVEAVKAHLAGQLPEGNTPGAQPGKAVTPAGRTPKVLTFAACREMQRVPRTEPPEYILVAPTAAWRWGHYRIQACRPGQTQRRVRGMGQRSSQAHMSAIQGGVGSPHGAAGRPLNKSILAQPTCTIPATKSKTSEQTSVFFNRLIAMACY